MATVGTITVTMDPATPAFAGTLAVGGTNASSFAISGNQLVTSGNVPPGTYNISITATQPGTTGSPRTQNFTLTGVSGGGPVEPPALPPPAAGQTALDFAWGPGPDSVGTQTATASPNVPFRCRVVRAVVRLTTSSTTAVQGWVTHYDNSINPPSGDHVQISDFFQLNQAPALIEVTGLQTTRIVNVGDWLHFRATSGAVPVTSAATGRIYIEPADGGGGPPPALPAVPSGQIGLDFSWVAGGGTLSTQTMTPTGNITQNCRLVRAVIRITGTDTVAAGAAVRWLQYGSQTASTMTDLLPLNQPPGLYDATGLNTTQLFTPNGWLYWGVMTDVYNANSVATARIFLQPEGGGGPTDGYLFPINATGALTHNFAVGSLGTYYDYWEGIDVYLASSARTVTQLSITFNNSPGNNPNRGILAVRYTPANPSAPETEVGWAQDSRTENPTSGTTVNLMETYGITQFSLAAGQAVWLGFNGSWGPVAMTLNLTVS